MNPPNSYDRWQFEKPAKPVSQKTCISYSDLLFMQTSERVGKRCRAWIPEFVTNPESLRLAIAQKLFDYINNGHRRLLVPPELVVNWHELVKMADARFAEIKARDVSWYPDSQKQSHKYHIEAVEAAGGYAQLICAVAWRSWRCGDASPEVAASIPGLSAVGVRQILHRIVDGARKHGLAIGRQHWTRGKKRRHETGQIDSRSVAAPVRVGLELYKDERRSADDSAEVGAAVNTGVSV
jgi:hypothetical protein